MIVCLHALHLLFSGNHLQIINDLRKGRYQTYSRERKARDLILEEAKAKGLREVMIVRPDWQGDAGNLLYGERDVLKGSLGLLEGDGVMGGLMDRSE